MSQVVVEKQKFYNAADVSVMMGVSVVSGYRIIKKLNEQLAAEGYITIAGKISKRYFNERVYI